MEQISLRSPSACSDSIDFLNGHHPHVLGYFCLAAVRPTPPFSWKVYSGQYSFWIRKGGLLSSSLLNSSWFLWLININQKMMVILHGSLTILVLVSVLHNNSILGFRNSLGIIRITFYDVQEYILLSDNRILGFISFGHHHHHLLRLHCV